MSIRSLPDAPCKLFGDLCGRHFRWACRSVLPGMRGPTAWYDLRIQRVENAIRMQAEWRYELA